MKRALAALFLLCLTSAAHTAPADPDDREGSQPRAVGVVLGDDGRPLPLDADGVPLRPLSDGELFRLLVYLSNQLEAAAVRLARCHAEGTPYGTLGWRACVERP